MNVALPLEISQGATIQGNEYGWSVSSFPDALATAQAHGYACLGGQFQFRSVDGICEMYWVNADSKDRLPQESWSDYCRRSCSEVLERFHQRIANTDFTKEGLRWPVHIDPVKDLVFVAYFVSESDLAD